MGNSSTAGAVRQTNTRDTRRSVGYTASPWDRDGHDDSRLSTYNKQKQDGTSVNRRVLKSSFLTDHANDMASRDRQRLSETTGNTYREGDSKGDAKMTSGTTVKGTGMTMRAIQQILRTRRARRRITVVPATNGAAEQGDGEFNVNAYLSHDSVIPWNTGTSLAYSKIARNALLGKENKQSRSRASRASSRKTGSEDADSGWQSSSETMTTITKSSKTTTLTRKTSNTSDQTVISSLPDKTGTIESVPEVNESIEPEVNNTSIRLRVDSDVMYCWITGSFLLNDSTLIVCDHNNKCVKVVNLVTNRVESLVHMADKPWDITKVRTGHAFLTMPYLQEIHCLVLVDGTLYKYPQATIKVAGTCFGIVSTQDTLIVTFTHPPKIEILDTKGDVLKTFTTNNVGAQLVQVPKYVCTSPRGDIIYVTDWSNDSVTCISKHGAVLSTYKHYDLRDPSGLATDLQFNVYICSRHTNTIHVIRSTGQRVKIVFGENDGIHSPLTITHHFKRKKIYVGNIGDNLKILDVPKLRH